MMLMNILNSLLFWLQYFQLLDYLSVILDLNSLKENLSKATT